MSRLKKMFATAGGAAIAAVALSAAGWPDQQARVNSVHSRSCLRHLMGLQTSTGGTEQETRPVREGLGPPERGARSV